MKTKKRKDPRVAEKRAPTADPDAAARAEPAAEAHPAEESDPAAPRGADELDFMPSRQKSTPLKPATLREKLARVVEPARLRRPFEGIQAHAEGTLLNELYMRHADAVLGFRSWRQLLLASFPEDDPRTAYDRQRVALFCTETEAALGIAKCLRGIRLFPKLKLRKFGELLDPPVVVKLPGGGEATFVRASVADLDSVLRHLGDEGDEEDETRGEALQHTRKAVDGLLEKEPEYRGLRPTASLQDDGIEVRTRPRGRAGYLLAARFYAALARRV